MNEKGGGTNPKKEDGGSALPARKKEWLVARLADTEVYS